MSDWHIDGRDVFIQDWETNDEMSIGHAQYLLNENARLKEIEVAARHDFHCRTHHGSEYAGSSAEAMKEQNQAHQRLLKALEQRPGIREGK